MFEESLKDVGSARNLADVKVVDRLIREFIHAAGDAEDEKEISRVFMKYAEIFCGYDTTYHGNEQWRWRGIYLPFQQRCGIKLEQKMGHFEFWREALANLFSDYVDIVEQHHHGMAEVTARLMTDRLIWFWTSLILGTVDVLYPDYRSWKQGPINEAELLKVGSLQKAHNSGYTRKDGVYVKPFDDSRRSAYWKPAVTKPAATGGKYMQFSGYKSSENKKEPESAKLHMSVHPKKDENGNNVVIKNPTEPSNIGSWENTEEVAVAAPGCKMPESLNGIPFEEWKDAPKSLDEWEYVDGQIDLDEDEIKEVPEKGVSTGVIIQEPDGRVWATGPTNQFGGYIMTYPKGRLEEGISYQANAIKEVYEETGLQVEITGLLGDFERTTTVTRMYTGRRVSGNPANMGWESQFIALVPKDRLKELVSHQADQPINDKIGELL